jgi:dTDP-4-amino-4,6-dideoxygalactose transaminase
VKRAFDSGYVAPCGPQVDEFERRLAALAGRRYAVAVSSGTAAIDLLMEELGVDRTWTVVAPTLTFIATVGPAFHRGAKLVFVDCDATGNIDTSLIEQA